jgi:hypothetical protein
MPEGGFPRTTRGRGRYHYLGHTLALFVRHLGEMQKWSILVALLVADMVPTVALRDCVVQALQPQPPIPLPAWLVQPHGPVDSLRLAITLPDGRPEGPRHFDPCLAQNH